MLPAASLWISTGSPSTFFRSHSRAVSHVWRECDPLRAVFIAGQRAKFFQLGDGPFGIERGSSSDMLSKRKIIVTNFGKASINSIKGIAEKNV